MDAVVVWFELDLDATERLTSEPGVAGADCHWHVAVWLLPRARTVCEGEGVVFRYRRTATGTRLDLE